MITAGTLAPGFEVATDDGAVVTLGQHRGHWVVLYFFPKADTPG